MLLSEADYVNVIKSTITKTISHYESDTGVDDVLLWKMLKLKIIRDASMKINIPKLKGRR